MDCMFLRMEASILEILPNRKQPEKVRYELQQEQLTLASFRTELPTVLANGLRQANHIKAISIMAKNKGKESISSETEPVFRAFLRTKNQTVEENY